MTALPLSHLATSRSWQANFLQILPTVQTHAMVCFRQRNPADQEEAIAETLASACISYARLARQKKLAQVYPSTVATYAVKAVRAGRHVGGHQNCRDVLNPLTQKKKGIGVVSLNPWNNSANTWRNLLLASRKVSPADQACFNLDFATWMKQWPARHRRIINALASGDGRRMWRNVLA